MSFKIFINVFFQWIERAYHQYSLITFIILMNILRILINDKMMLVFNITEEQN